MKKLNFKNQGGYSFIGLWPWTGVYSGLSLYISAKFGMVGFLAVTVPAIIIAKLVADRTEASAMDGFAEDSVMPSELDSESLDPSLLEQTA